ARGARQPRRGEGGGRYGSADPGAPRGPPEGRRAPERLLHGPRADRGLGRVRAAHAGHLRDEPREEHPPRGGAAAAPAHPQRHRPPGGAWPRARTARAEPLPRERVFLAMPCGGGQTTSGEYLESMTASRDYAENEPLTESRTRGQVEVMREAIHDAKGMLRE